MFSPTVQNQQTDALVRALLTLKTPEDAYRFLEDLCTVAEIKSLAQRLDVADKLLQGVTYQEIARQTRAATATIGRVNRALHYGAEGYRQVLARLRHDENQPQG